MSVCVLLLQRDIETAIKNSQVHTKECLDVGVKECPVFHPTEEEFSNPARFIQSISENIEKVYSLTRRQEGTRTGN